MVREPSPLRARSQGAERGEAPSPREAKRATHCSETSWPGDAGETRAERLSHQRDSAPRGKVPPNPRQGRLGRGQQRGRVGAKPGGDVATQAARQPCGDKPLEGWIKWRPHHRVSGLEREGNRPLSPRAGGHLSQQGGIGWFPLEQPAKIEELHQAENESVLEGRVEREVHEQIFARGHLLHETDSPAAAPPGSVEVEGKEPGAGGDPAMKLDDRARRAVEEGPGVIGLSLLGEACLLQQRNRPGPLVEHQQVDIPHGAMGDGVVEALGKRGPLEG